MLNRKSLIYLFNYEVLLQSYIQCVILNVLQMKGCLWQMCILMAKKIRFDALRKKQLQIDAYYEKIKEIEQKMGRIYSQPKENESYVDRLIDIDILFYNKLLINCNYLKIPHPQIYSREFIKSFSFY